MRLLLVTSLDSIVTEYGANSPALFFFYPGHIYDALTAIVSNYSTRTNECREIDMFNAPLMGICADMDQYIDREYAVNAPLPREIDQIVGSLTDHVFDDLLFKVHSMFHMYLGEKDFRVDNCRFIPNSNDMLVKVALL